MTAVFGRESGWSCCVFVCVVRKSVGFRWVTEFRVFVNRRCFDFSDLSFVDGFGVRCF